MILVPIILRLIHQHSNQKSSQRRVHPTNNLRPQGQQILSRGGQQVGQFQHQTRLPGQRIAPPSNGQLSGQQISPPKNLPSAGQPMWGTSPSGQYPPPAGRQITPSAGQLPQPTGQLPPPTSQPPPYPGPQQVSQPQPPPYIPHPLSSAGPGQSPVSTAPPQRQTSSNTAVPLAIPPPAPEGLYRNSEYTEPPPAPKVT
ncbi:hypothetical protein LSH36_3g20003 [Paralvinella palmiformis]|uniref:Uncharacterized protein n=1 Tax=Paralvinella palmiformis TaxID=53620 RepID=A0AAD9KGJ5_9ANNE|nr:hypothetical protein LSH36_3g20003 [Paralvinella palmiformis]